MSAKPGFLVLFLAVMAFLAMAVPHAAFAQGGSVSTTTDVCGPPGTNAIDQAFQNSMAQAGTRVSQDITNAWNGMQKIGTAGLQCITKIRSLYSTLANSINGVSDPLHIIMSIVGPMVLNLVNTACTMVMSDIMQAANAALSMLKICLPPLTFGFGFHLNMPSGCSGGMNIPLLSGTGANMSPPSSSLVKFY